MKKVLFITGVGGWGLSGLAAVLGLINWSLATFLASSMLLLPYLAATLGRRDRERRDGER
ncbi:MAG TPA: hypothetical protein VH561_01995 [Micromonosporaceae bacterium]|jgi:hypothetical protein